MKQQKKQNGSFIAIVTMMFLYAMISFVTNLAAPLGVIWKGQEFIGGSNTLGMLGNMMNFLAYLFMGIPAGKMLVKVGYKKTALTGIACGFVGVGIQFLSGTFEPGWTGFVIYLIGAFIAGLCVCMLNTVVNPMLNLLGGGGNKGNQLNMIGGTFNSLAGTLTPMLVGAMIGQIVTYNDVLEGKATVGDITQLSVVNLVMFIALAVFALSFIILLFVPIQDPEGTSAASSKNDTHSAWSFRHFVLGAIGIFIYVGIEVGIPGTLNFYLSDTTAKGAWVTQVANAAAIGGFVAGTYWLLMLVGRIVGGAIASKVSSRTMMVVVTSLGMLLILGAMFVGKDHTTTMPLFTGSAFEMQEVPLSALLLVLCGLCTSVMWSCIFNLATEGLGKYTAAASGIFMMMVVGGGVLPLIQNAIADSNLGYMMSYIVPFLGLAYLCYYALIGSKNVNKDIPVE